MKFCPFSLNNPDGAKECLCWNCMAWLDEINIDLSTIDPMMAEVMRPLLKSLMPAGVSVNADGTVKIAAHCVLLEPKK